MFNVKCDVSLSSWGFRKSCNIENSEEFIYQHCLRTSRDTAKFVINGTDGNWNRKSGWKLFLVDKWNLKI